MTDLNIDSSDNFIDTFSMYLNSNEKLAEYSFTDIQTNNDLMNMENILSIGNIGDENALLNKKRAKTFSVRNEKPQVPKKKRKSSSEISSLLSKNSKSTKEEKLLKQVRTIQCILDKEKNENYIGRKKTMEEERQEGNSNDIYDEKYLKMDTETLKRDLKRLKNRIAAQKSRKNKKSKISQIELENALLKQENRELKSMSSCLKYVQEEKNVSIFYLV